MKENCLSIRKTHTHTRFCFKIYLNLLKNEVNQSSVSIDSPKSRLMNIFRLSECKKILTAFKTSNCQYRGSLKTSSPTHLADSYNNDLAASIPLIIWLGFTQRSFHWNWKVSFGILKDRADNGTFRVGVIRQTGVWRNTSYTQYFSTT